MAKRIAAYAASVTIGALAIMGACFIIDTLFLGA